MERIKRMKLKKALAVMTFISLLTAAAISTAAVVGCGLLRASLAPEGFIVEWNGDGTGIIKQITVPTESERAVGMFFSVLQIILPVLFFLSALTVNAALFYRWKLKEPLHTLMEGAERIMNNDLDFSIRAEGGDELGQLLTAFEKMRGSLKTNTEELWRQNEERKRLNAAFSHDLRNPLTVLKGSAKIAKKCAGSADTTLLMENLDRIEGYTGRIEKYVETMSKVQRMEQMEVKPEPVEYQELAAELKRAFQLAAAERGKELCFTSEGNAGKLLLDRDAFYQIAENLAANGLRFAKKKLWVALCLKEGELLLTVADDGRGFSEELIKKGIQPFKRGKEKENEDGGHFGMGLYICRLLCEKHGGYLEIKNREGKAGGAVCRAAVRRKSGTDGRGGCRSVPCSNRGVKGHLYQCQQGNRKELIQNCQTVRK